MLEYLRNASEKPVAKILMGLLIFSFVGWGVAEWLFSNTSKQNVLLTVGGSEITTQQFNIERSREFAKLSKADQKQLYLDPLSMNNFYRTVLSDLTTNTLIEKHAENLGFAVSDKKIADEILQFEQFSENGKFSPEKFDRVLMDSGFTENQFADYLRGTVLRQMVMGTISVPVLVPKFSVNATYFARYHTKEIEYTAVKFDDFKVSAKPEDKQLREFYAKNPKIIPEVREISYVLVTAVMSAPDTYDNGYAQIQKVEDAIISGESMTSAAAKNKAAFVKLPPRGIDAAATTLLSRAIIEKLFKAEQGDESEIIETKEGFLIARVDKVIPEHIADFDSVKSGLVASWARNEQKKQAYLKANEILVKLNNDKILQNKIVANVSRTSGAPNDILVAAFANSVGVNTIAPSENTFYVLHIGKEIAPALDNVKMKSLRIEMESFSKREILSDYNAFLSRKYPIKINQKALDKLFVK